jgi:DNA repair exonuclease SbcCD nuclease subunit
MKLLVTGDWHARKDNLAELKHIFVQLLTLLQNCDGLVILGDVFDSAKPCASVITTIISFLKKVPHNKKLYIISGNHDIDRTENATEWIPLEHPNIVYDPHVLTLNVNNKTIRMMHTNVSESEVGPQHINISGLSYKVFQEDIILLGHIHKSQVISEKPLVLHPGAPFYLRFGERNDKKGVYIVNVNKDVTYDFKPLDTVLMYQVNVTQNGFEEAERELNAFPTQSKIKVIFNINSYTLEIASRMTKLIRKYRSKFYQFKYELKIQQQPISIKTNMKQESIQQLFNKFCQKEKVDPKIQQLIKELLK